MIKKVFVIALLVLIVIQFIQPARNQQEGMSPLDITQHLSVPAEVETVLAKACRDCHSNNTRYPWYDRAQPVAWWIAYHVKEGKHELNFSEFASYNPKKQRHKLKEIVEQVKEGEMPMTSYTWMHPEARLTQDEKSLLTSWAETTRTALTQQYQLPPESSGKRPE
jgi:hypothetical protein